MNFSSTALAYQQTGYFSRVITEYLAGNDFLKTFYEHEASLAGVEASMHDRELFPTDRTLLARVLKEQYEGQQLQPVVNKNIDRLENQNTFTITTAHQPAIFTGTLYFIYKILHVIKIASTLCERFPDKHFVPVFYMGSEDADLDELGHIYLDNEKLNWETRQTGAVGRMHPEGLEKIVERLEGEFAGAPFGPELLQLLKDCYLGTNNIQQATLKLLHHLFGAYGLIVLIPDNRLLKAVMRGIFKDDLTSHIPFQITENNTRLLSAQFPIQAKPREINLFYLRDDIRERLDLKDGKFAVNHTNIQFTAEELESELANFPERFSPNVILRGLFQETILPNIAFVGGGGEAAYWLELKPLFKHYRVPFPVIILRNSFLLIGKKSKGKIDKAELTAISVFRSSEELIEEYIKQHSTRQLTLPEQICALGGVYETVKQISGAVDHTLEQHVEKLKTQARNKLLALEKKILRAEKKNHEDVRSKINDIKETLFPLGNLQERIDNFIPWYAQFGSEFISMLLKHSNTFEQQFVVLEEES